MDTSNIILDNTTRLSVVDRERLLQEYYRKMYYAIRTKILG